MNKRLSKIKEYMKKASLDSLLVTDRKNMRYLSGYTGEGYMLISDSLDCIVTDFRYTYQATMQTKDFEIYDISRFKPKDIFGSYQNTGYENESIKHQSYLSFKEIFKNLTPIKNELLKHRSVKDYDEINSIRKAQQIADSAFDHILPYIKAGVSERDIALEIEFFMRKSGAEALSFDTIVATGSHGAMAHAEPDNRLISNGDFVVMDFGCVYNGYSSDMTRTVCLGRATDEMKKIYNTVLKAQLSSLDMLRAGVKASDVHKNAQSIIDEQYPGLFGHSLGHGVGLDIHELPNLSPKNDEPLKEGNVVTVEPGIYVNDFCGVRIEDLVVIKEDGIENLTHSDKNLMELW